MVPDAQMKTKSVLNTRNQQRILPFIDKKNFTSETICFHFLCTNIHDLNIYVIEIIINISGTRQNKKLVLCFTNRHQGPSFRDVLVWRTELAAR